MSVNYASGLSEYKNKGTCGTKELIDSDKKLARNIKILAEWIRKSKHCVIYCGAGISTAAGIPDFRGPNGVWTLEKRGQKPDESKMKSFDQCIPTFTHLAIITMINKGLVKHVVSQNIDGLFLKANIDRENLSELHGNYFVDECIDCHSRFIRHRPSPTMGCKFTGDKCAKCDGPIHDTILDWEQELPDNEFDRAQIESEKCDLAICLGTSLQIEPANLLPLEVLKKSDNQHENTDDHLNKLVIINLQRTKFDRHADLIIHHYVDKVMELICQHLMIQISPYESALDPTKSGHDLIPWNRNDFRPTIKSRKESL
uniref:protein acetyllysine N-acetyltransferase n=1 Tax=Dermatophagoides pteronyssinus TaxID=6956 RepID=A0A6P6Y1K2_DERPT|nr:NAD-dependent protein deacetylase Sirt6-like [Dermatophagoides pteronyssinus]XP_027199137.1 NAD-dependent protein deacetylase Sirt6-like [Dermatophagoides pteronyssinus]